MRFTRFLPLAPLALVAACVPRVAAPPPEPAPPAPAPAPAPIPTPTPAPTNWMDAAQTPGNWSYADGAASFGLPSDPRLVLSCARTTRSITIAYLGVQSELMTIHTETAERTLSAGVAAQPAQSLATLNAQDSFLDAIAFSKGRIAVEADGQAIYVPAWPEISRVIEDCR